MQNPAMNQASHRKSVSPKGFTAPDALAAQEQLPERVGSTAMKVLRPLARLFIAHGLTFGDAEKALKQAFFDAGKEELKRAGIESNMSRLSVSTGLHRKDIRRFVDQSVPGQGQAHQPMRSIASEIYTRWVTDRALADKGRPIDLPLRGDADAVSFEWLARQISTDAHPRSLLEDLKRLGLVVITEEGKVRVDAGGFIPILARTEMLELLGENVADHLDTAVGNVVEDGDKRLEQSVFASGLSAQAINQIESVARPIWASVLQKVVTAMKRADKKNPATTDQPTYRIRTGMFFYTDQPRRSDKSKAAAADRPVRRPRK